MLRNDYLNVTNLKNTVMNNPKPMLTLSEVMEKLRQKGITNEIRMTDDKRFVISGTEKSYQPEDLKIIRTYRFEGESDPADNVALYLIKDNYENIAMIIDSYGANSNYEGPDFDRFLKRIPEVEVKEEFDF